MKFFSFFTSCLGLLIILILFGLIAASLAGVDIPYLSQVLYKESPKLDRVVLVSADRGKNQLQKIATGSVVLDESDFSSILSAGFMSRTPYIKLVKTNIYPDKIKLLITFGKGRDYYFFATLIPANDGGKLNIKSAQVGNLPIPIFAARWFLGNALDLSNVFKGYGLRVNNMNLNDGEIQLNFVKK